MKANKDQRHLTEFKGFYESAVSCQEARKKARKE